MTISAGAIVQSVFGSTRDQRVQRATNYGLAIAVLIAVVVIEVYCGFKNAALSAFGASVAVGAVLGFLFAVPSPTNGKVPSGASGGGAGGAGGGQAGEQVAANAGAASAAGATAQSSRSNLEQVADWVTKLLLGGGLTQLQKIPGTIWRWAREVAIGIDPNAQDEFGNALPLEGHQAFAAGLMVYGFVLGFFGGFLITKMQLGKVVGE